MPIDIELPETNQSLWHVPLNAALTKLADNSTADPLFPVALEHVNPFRIALNRALFDQAHVQVAGDSIVFGANANETATDLAADQLLKTQRGWVAQLRKLFETQYGDVGEGIITFGSTDELRWTYSGTTAASSAGPVGMGRSLSAGGSMSGTFGPFTTLDYVGTYSAVDPIPFIKIDTVDMTPTKLSSTQKTFTIGASDWANRSNCTPTKISDAGEDVLRMTSAAGGNMAAQTPLSTSGRPCSPGEEIIVSGELRSAVSARSWRIGAVFINAAGTQISEATTSTLTSTPGSWQQNTAKLTAPALTVYVNFIVRVDSTGAGSEVHDFRRAVQMPVTSEAGASSISIIRAQITGLSDATHVIDISNRLSGTLQVSMLMVRRSTTSGVVVSRVGKSGSTSYDHAGNSYSANTQSNNMKATFTFRPDLLIIMLGANDVNHQEDSQAITPTAFKANLKLLTDIQETNGGCTLIVAGPRYGTDSTPAGQQEFYDAAAELALAEDAVAFIDIGQGVWGGNAQANTDGFMNNALYTIHPTLAGHGDIARLVFSAITRQLSAD